MIPYEIKVNANQIAMDSVSVIDSIPTGTSLVTTGGKEPKFQIITNDDTLHPADATISFITNSENKVVFTLPALTQGQYGILTYALAIDVNSIEAFQNSASAKLDNSAQLSNQYFPTNGPSSTASKTLDTKLVNKTGMILSPNSIGYVVKLNASKATLPADFIITDTLSCPAMNYYIPSIVLYEGTVDGSGNVTKIEPNQVIDSSYYSVTIGINSSNCSVMTLKLKQTIDKPMVLEYCVAVDNTAAGPFVNNVQIGSGTTPAKGKISFTASQMKKSSGSGGLYPASYAQIKVTKKDYDDDTIALANATYKIYSDAATTNEIGMATTNAAGIATFFGLRANTTYYIKEFKAPTGYDLDATVMAFTTMGNNTSLFKTVTGRKTGSYTPTPPIITVPSVSTAGNKTSNTDGSGAIEPKKSAKDKTTVSATVLPKTGGYGATLLFSVLAVLLIVVGIVMVVLSGKKRKGNE